MPSTAVCVPVKYFGHEIRFESDGVENLRAAIGLIGRDAHFGHDLHQAFADSLHIAVEGFLLFEGLLQLTEIGLDGLEREVGVDRLRAIAGQHRELMDLMRFAGLDDKADRGAQALADQMMMDRARCEKARDRNAVRAHVAVGQDDDVPALQHNRLRPAAQPVERALHARRALDARCR